MLDSVDGFPWVAQQEGLFEERTLSCALGVQQQLADLGEPGSGLDGTADVAVVSDLRALRVDGRGSKVVLSAARSVADSYRERGRRLADELVADGVVAIWDRTRQALLCWRDVTGTRPLYYHYRPHQTFVFSSDLTAILAHPQVAPVVDLSYARTLLEVGEDGHHPSRTLCREVRKLPAGHALAYESGRLTVWRYWRPEEFSDRRHRDDGTYAEELRSLVREAVRVRVSGAGPTVGAHLSGGLDSSSIAVMAAQELGPSVMTPAYSWAPPLELVPPIAGDERPLAAAAAGVANNLELSYARPEARCWIDVMTRDLSRQPTTTLQVEAASARVATERGLSLMLSGWGGDELAVFNGRGYFADLARRGRLLRIDGEFRRRRRIQGGTALGQWRHRVLRPLLPDVLHPAFGFPDPRARRELPGELRPDVAAALRSVDRLEDRTTRELAGVRRNQLALISDGHLQYRMESWASFGASLGLTYAYPLLDPRIVEFALSVPDHLYFKDGWKRWLYRTAMNGVLPDVVRWHPHKQDNAMAVSLGRTRGAARAPFMEALGGRNGNPFVDTEVLLEHMQRNRPDDRLGHGFWAAFLNLELP